MDLANPSNWSLISSLNLRGELIAKYGEGTGALEMYSGIPPQTASLATPIGLVKTTAPLSEIKPNWFRACKVEAYLPFTSGNIQGSVYRKWCGLNQGTFLQIPDFGTYPYQLKIYIPDYLISLQIEVWQFTSQSGQYDQANQAAVLSAVEVVEQRTQEMQTTIAFIANRDVVKTYNVETD